MKLFCYITVFAILLSACTMHSVQISKVAITKESLASTFARSPDPDQENPPTGERLYITFFVPRSLDPKDHKLVLSMIYKDLSEETMVFPLTQRMGVTSFSLLDEKFRTKGGFYAYRVELQNKDGAVIDVWEHQMWVTIIN